jgi:uncharacterized membrane protein YcaP (DUF421 family)
MLGFFNDIEQFFLGEAEWSFMPEIVLRTLLMYIVVLISLRLLGKRGVKQLSVFELVVIISLGSAAGDPMFYKEVGIGSAIVVFLVIVMAYKITSYLVNKSKNIEVLLEGKCTCLIEDGKFTIENFKKEGLAQDEFFAELRLQSISHLGQVELAIIETNGSVSVFLNEEKDVRFGLPILPKLFEKKLTSIEEDGYHSCSFCGNTTYMLAGEDFVCKRCGKALCVKSINKLRIS